MRGFVVILSLLAAHVCAARVSIVRRDTTPPPALDFPSGQTNLTLAAGSTVVATLLGFGFIKCAALCLAL